MQWEYYEEIFDRTTVARMANHFSNLLQAATDRTASSVETMAIMDEEERRHLLNLCNGNHVPCTSTNTIGTLFEAQVQRTPQAPALFYNNQETSYSELNRLANGLAHLLVAKGLGPETAVGIAGVRCSQTVVGMLAIIKAGAAYVPLDPTLPPARLGLMVRETGINLILSPAKATAPLSVLKRPTLDLDEVCGSESGMAFTGAGNPPCRNGAADLAYILYTSGSTGKPKGVGLSHGNSVAILEHPDYFPVYAGDSVLHAAPLGFDASIIELWLPLAHGARVCIFPEGHLDLGLLGAFIRDNHIATAWLTSGLFSQMVDLQLDNLSGLRQMFTGGDQLSYEHVSRYLQKYPDQRFSNGYGPTENSTVTTTEDINENGLSRGILIGRPLPDATIYVLDRHLQPVPVGVCGELLIGGSGLARGYVGSSALTAERFVPHPFAVEPGQRLYCTGDLVRLFNDGNLAFIGRRDGQVKIRGFRIEVGEIERALVSHPQIEKAAVVVRTDLQSGKALVGYLEFVKQPGAALDSRQLRSFLLETLPPFMLPAGFVALDQLPLSHNGKLDRKALQRRPLTDFESLTSSQFVAPRTPLEKDLAGIWQELLGIQEIGIHDQFFDLGGHSLLATSLVARIRSQMGLELQVRTIFENATIAALAGWIDGQKPASKIPPVTAHARDQAPPLSFGQQRLWFLDRLARKGERGSATYNITAALRATGTLDQEALQKAINRLGDRHEVLRTNFREQKGQPIQVIHAKPSLDLIHQAAADERELKRCIRDEAVYCFDLANEPLLRLVLVAESDDRTVLLVNMHHIISDGWSMSIFIDELAAIYDSERRGERIELPPLPIQFADYAHWQQRDSVRRQLEQQAAWWNQSLQDLPLLHQLPTDRPRPAQHSNRGSGFDTIIDPTTLRRLNKMAEEAEASLFMVLLAAFKVLVARYSGCSDIAVGTPIANRNHGKLEPLIGFFVNTLVMRTSVDPAMSFNELLEAVKQTSLEAYAHQDVPFERVVERCSPERSLSYSPLFQLMFCLQNMSRRDIELPGLTMQQLPVEFDIAKFDLTTTCMEGHNGLTVQWEYYEEIFDKTTVARMANHYRHLLCAVAENGATPVAALALMDREERQQVLALCNPTRVSPASGNTIQTLFEAQVQRTPRAPALFYRGRQLTYEELNGLANNLAYDLIAKGIGPETAVGIAGLRCSRIVIGMLAILKAGAAYVPLDPDLPPARLTLMVEETGMNFILSTPEVTPRLKALERPIIELNQTGPAASNSGPVNLQNPPCRVGESELAYILYTSGSTGKPKGVALSHGSAAAILERPDYFLAIKGLSVLHAAPLGFDASIIELWLPLAHGARVCIFPEGPLDLTLLGTFIRENNIAAAWLTSGLFSQMVDLQLGDLGGLKQLLSGGDQLSHSHVSRFLQAHPDCRFTNGYGPTENTTFSTCEDIDESQLERGILIGHPLEHVTVYVLDPLLEPVPIGVSGELFLGGRGLARGYMGAPALTAERFVPHPYATEAGRRLYRTGDQVRAHQDGKLTFLGRRDGQVKIRGYRIEVAEIERALESHPQIEKAAVIVRNDLHSGKALVGFLELVEPGEPVPDSRQLRQFLLQSLPSFMLPAGFIAVDQLPLSHNGKLNRGALQQRSLADFQPLTSVAFVAPRTALEADLAQIWAELLGHQEIGVHDQFFDLGGHSLLATSLVARIGAQMGHELPVRTIFENPTIAALAARLESLDPGGSADEAIPLDPKGVLSASQARLWGFFKQQGATPAYNVTTVLKIEGPFQLTALSAALTAMIERHESLRTTFGQKGEQPPFQTVHPPEPADINVIEMGDMEQALALMERESLHLFDLEKGPLLRLIVVRLAEDLHLLNINMHHIITDGWSMGVFIREAAIYWRAFMVNPKLQSPILPPPVMQFPDYARRERGYLNEEKMKRQLAWWGDELRGLLPMKMPTDAHLPHQPNHQAGQLELTLDAAMTAKLADLSKRHNASLFMLLTAAFSLMLARFTNQKDLAVGTPIAGRRRTEWEGLIGFMVSGLLLRIRLGDLTRFSDLLDHVRQVALDAYANQDIPFTKVVQAFHEENSGHDPSLPQAMISLQNLPTQVISLPQLKISPMEVEAPVAKYDLTLVLAEQGDCLVGNFIYRSNIFREATAQAMMGDFLQLLDLAVADPTRPLNLIPAPDARQGRVPPHDTPSAQSDTRQP